ncbi:MAG: hypothetical protein SV765_11865 [Pseudomonadota bacterium]|nr:hypothetical protein [Pseudomonadota bacterium]
MKHIIGMAFITLIASCSVLQPNSEYSLERQGVVFDQLAQLRRQVEEGQRPDPELVRQIRSTLEQEDNPLALGDLNYLLGMAHYIVMRADQQDPVNYRLAESYFAAAEHQYHKLNEDWLEANASYGKALTYFRAAEFDQGCMAYEHTVKLLDSGDGKIREFFYDESKFDQPKAYVEGVLGLACNIKQRLSKN